MRMIRIAPANSARNPAPDADPGKDRFRRLPSTSATFAESCGDPGAGRSGGSAERVYTVNSFSEHLSVAKKTISRWRRHGPATDDKTLIVAEIK